MTAGIYIIINTITEQCYIGRSTRIEIRWKSHQSGLNLGQHHNRLLSQDWRLYGAEAFKCCILQAIEVENLMPSEVKEQLVTAELDWMSKLNPDYNVLHCGKAIADGNERRIPDNLKELDVKPQQVRKRVPKESSESQWMPARIPTCQSVLERIQKRAISLWGRQEWQTRLTAEYSGISAVRRQKLGIDVLRSQVELIFANKMCDVDTLFLLGTAVGYRFQVVYEEEI